MPPVSDPENWNWTTWSFAMMMGFGMHNTSYRITVQWRYGVYMKGPRGPFQTSIVINVQNLVVTSPDETKVLKWDPVRGIADTSFSYRLEYAQKKVCDVCISIYSTDGRKVYEPKGYGSQKKKVYFLPSHSPTNFGANRVGVNLRNLCLLKNSFKVQYFSHFWKCAKTIKVKF